MTDPLRRELREELAKAINKTRPPTCDHPQCSCMYECERHDDMADSYLDAVDAMTPILTREIARARAEEREEAAKLADKALLVIENMEAADNDLQLLWRGGGGIVAREIAAAIRARGGE